MARFRSGAVASYAGEAYGVVDKRLVEFVVSMESLEEDVSCEAAGTATTL